MQRSVQTRCLCLDAGRDQALTDAASVLTAGGIVAFPTETVYGLGVRYGDAAALASLHALKDREGDKPFQVLIAEAAAAAQLGAVVSPLAERLMTQFWPGPLTLVLPDGAGGSVGLRLPANDWVRDLVRTARTPVVATSANRAGAPPALDADVVRRVFGGHVELIVDGGPVRLGQASTVVRVEGAAFTILREGAIASRAIGQLA